MDATVAAVLGALISASVAIPLTRYQTNKARLNARGSVYAAYADAKARRIEQLEDYRDIRQMSSVAAARTDALERQIHMLERQHEEGGVDVGAAIEARRAESAELGAELENLARVVRRFQQRLEQEGPGRSSARASFDVFASSSMQGARSSLDKAIAALIEVMNEGEDTWLDALDNAEQAQAAFLGSANKETR